MKTKKIFFIALLISLNAFSQMPHTTRIGGGNFIMDDSRAGLVKLPVKALEPFASDSSSFEDTVEVSYHTLTPEYVKSVKECTECIANKTNGSKALKGKFKKHFVHSSKGDIDSLFSLAGGSLYCYPCNSNLMEWA